MERFRVEKRIGVAKYFDSADHPTPIKDLQEWLEKIKAEGVTHIRWKSNIYLPSNPDVEATPISIEFESDNEYASRLHAENERKRAALDQEERDQKAIYKLLKKRFDP